MRRLTFNALFSGMLSIVVLNSQLKAESEPDSASDSKPTVTTIAGVFESLNAKEISAGTEQIESFTIDRIVPHGTQVKAGQNVVWFETETIDDKVKAAEIEQRLAKLTLEDDEFKHQQFLKAQKLDREAAQRDRKAAQQAYDNFVKVDRDRSVKSANFNLQSSQNSLENAMEELKQLQQMYDEDDLTEESEEIVLKRAKRSVESAQFRLEGTEISTQRALAQTIPRSVADQDAMLARAELAYQKSMRDLNSANARQAIEIARKREVFKKAQEKFEELKQERKRIVLTSPIDGIVLHGKLTRGKLSDKPSTLQQGSKVTPTQILATVVSPVKLQIRVDLDEQHLSIVEPGTACTVNSKAFSGFETKGIVKSVSSVPFAGSKFDCVVTFKPGKTPVMPTMTCELKFTTQQSKEVSDVQKIKPSNKNQKAVVKKNAEQKPVEKKAESSNAKKKQGS